MDHQVLVLVLVVLLVMVVLVLVLVLGRGLRQALRLGLRWHRHGSLRQDTRATDG
jgi:uncharacterized protein HemY